MPVDRKLAAAPLTSENTPQWRCPTCEVGHFRLIKKTLHCELEGPLEMAQREDWFDAEHAKFRFAALLRCSNESCKEVASLAGTGVVEEYPDEESGDRTYENLFFPTYFNPSPQLINVPTSCPDDVRAQLRRAFVASWDEPGAAAGRIRIGAELLLTHLRAPKTKPNRSGGRTWLTLHQRIEALPSRFAEVADALLAIKWLGNAGAHEAEMTRDTVYDAFDIVESVLQKCFSNDHKHVERLVKAVNRRKGPAAKAKSRN